jgi:hypothetical protein
MAIIFKPTNPKQLIQMIVREIKNESIATWRYDDDDNTFTHTTNDGQWVNRAYLIPKVNGEKLILGIVIPEGEEDQSTVYAVYHGRFAEMLLSHFDNYFDTLEMTSQPVNGIDEIN